MPTDDNPEAPAGGDLDDSRTTARSRSVVPPPPGDLGGIPAPAPDVGVVPPSPADRADVDAAFTPPGRPRVERPAAPPADEDLDAMVRRLLEQTAALPVLGDQIGTSLETFGDRLVDGLNEIFGNRLTTMLDEFQRSVRSELTESRARLDAIIL